MSKRNTNMISIITIHSQGEDEGLAMFPSPSKIIAKSTQVIADRLGENLSAFVRILGEAIEKLPQSCGGYSVDTLTFSLSIDSSGKISLVGELSAGFTSGITITLKKQGTSS